MEKNCNTCFYKEMTNSVHGPCQKCVNYNLYVKDSIYFWAEKHLEEEQYDPVDKPKHYMLMPEDGIEVRDVITALVKKIDNCYKYQLDGMDVADYVQAMQYFMRFMEKNGKEDLKKGVWYINKIIDAWEPHESDDT